MEATVLRFLAFLGAELLFIVATTVLVMLVGLFVLKSGQIKGRYVLATGAIAGVVSMLFVTFFLWILTGVGYASFFYTILAVSLVLMGLVELLWLIFGEPNVPWAERTVWYARELQIRFPRLTKAVQLAALAVFIVYPIYIGVGYFGERFASNQWHGYVLRATLGIILFGYLVNLPGQLYVMMSQNIAEGTRSRIFISQLIQAVVLLMMVSFFVWTLEPDAETFSFAGKVPLVGRFVAFTPVVLCTTLGYVVLALVIPYLIGHFRYRAWMAKLDGDRSVIVDELLLGARSPLINTANEALVGTERKIDASLNALETDDSYKLAEAVSSGTKQEIPLYKVSAEKSIQRDPRFAHAKKLTGLRKQIDDCLTVLTSAASDQEKRDLLKNFADSIRQQTPTGSNESAKPWVLSGITFVVLIITNSITTALLKWVASGIGMPIE